MCVMYVYWGKTDICILNLCCTHTGHSERCDVVIGISEFVGQWHIVIGFCVLYLDLSHVAGKTLCKGLSATV